MTCKETWPKGKGSPKDCVTQILNAHKIANTEYRFGKTKVFIRNPTTVCSLSLRSPLPLLWNLSNFCL